MSAVAKLLVSRGISVSGSDAVDSETLADLRSRGIRVELGHRPENLPDDTDIVVYTDAAPPENPELAEARRRGIRTIDTHAFLGELFKDATQIVVTGTHGKSTTTSMLGVALAATGENPTVVVGTKVPSFPDGNLRIGRDDLLIVEGDEYRRHVLSYRPNVLVLKQIEYDHPDAFPSMKEYLDMFHDLMGHVRDGGIIVYASDDPESVSLLRTWAEKLSEKNIRLVSVGPNGQIRVGDTVADGDGWITELRAGSSEPLRLRLIIPGVIYARNAAMALVAASAMSADEKLDDLVRSLSAFSGCWRRFERIGALNGAVVISDYGHHPSEVTETLRVAKSAFPDRRIVLCFQPHQRKRTRGLFDEFVPSFDLADVLILSEIYDVPGREAPEDAGVSSRALADAVVACDAERGRTRVVEFAPDLPSTEELVRSVASSNDLILMMGAGTIDGMARGMVERTPPTSLSGEALAR